MDTQSQQILSLYQEGYSARSIADSLQVSVSYVTSVVELGGVQQAAPVRYEDALRRMGLSEAYIAHVLRDQPPKARKTKKAVAEAVPVFDRTPWGEVLKAEQESTKKEERRRARRARLGLKEGFRY